MSLASRIAEDHYPHVRPDHWPWSRIPLRIGRTLFSKNRRSATVFLPCCLGTHGSSTARERALHPALVMIPPERGRHAHWQQGRWGGARRADHEGVVARDGGDAVGLSDRRSWMTEGSGARRAPPHRPDLRSVSDLSAEWALPQNLSRTEFSASKVQRSRARPGRGTHWEPGAQPHTRQSASTRAVAVRNHDTTARVGEHSRRCGSETG